jgi:hypothetical protein
MRLWSIHPRYLDPQGLVALWREGLLAQAVLAGRTRGYRHHPQLDRFKAQRAPLAAINAYLAAVYDEARARGYAFDRSKLRAVRRCGPIAVSSGQIAHEWRHLRRKLALRNPALLKRWRAREVPDCHPLFRVVAGGVEPWER